MLGVHHAAICTADVALVPPQLAVVTAPDGVSVELIGPAQ